MKNHIQLLVNSESVRDMMMLTLKMALDSVISIVRRDFAMMMMMMYEFILHLYYQPYSLYQKVN